MLDSVGLNAVNFRCIPNSFLSLFFQPYILSFGDMGTAANSTPPWDKYSDFHRRFGQLQVKMWQLQFG